jgi:hypothetical protein
MISDIRNALETGLKTIEGLNTCFQIPAVVHVPLAYIRLADANPVEYDFTAANSTLIYHFLIEILVMKGVSIEQAQDDLDPYLQNTGDKSVKYAVENAEKSGYDTLRVTGVTHYGAVAYSGTEYLGARLAVDIWV